jgi:hypothetical protein
MHHSANRHDVRDIAHGDLRFIVEPRVRKVGGDDIGAVPSRHTASRDHLLLTVDREIGPSHLVFGNFETTAGMARVGNAKALAAEAGAGI